MAFSSKMFYLVTIVLALTLIGLGKKFTLVGTWIRGTWTRIRFLIQILKGIPTTDTNAIPKESCQIHRDSTASISYVRGGNPYQVVVPFQRRWVAAMVDLKAELMYADGSVLEITQQPGIPYSFTAGDLGGVTIEVTNTSTGAKHSYSTTSPQFALEVMEEEE